MRMKSIIALLVALVFALGMVGLTFAADAKDVKGTVAKVDAKSVTVKDAAGKETVIDAAKCKDVKVGDKVTIMKGMCVKDKAPAKKSSGY